MQKPLNRRIGIFDSDCLERHSADSKPSRELTDFGVRVRMQPMAEKLDRLYAFANANDIPMVFTHCCGANPVTKGSHPDVLIVPMDAADRSWESKVPDYRLINIEKHYQAPLHRSFICRHFDMFQHNPNAARLFHLLDIPRWILFGHGFDLCVDSAAKGIIAAGYQVHILTDVIASSASGYGPYGTEESKNSIMNYLLKIGATTGTLEDFLREYET